MLGLTVAVFSAVAVQHAGVRLLHQNVFHTGIRPEKLPITGFVRKLLKIYRREYKRRFAWIRAGKISKDAFTQWLYRKYPLRRE